MTTRRKFTRILELNYILLRTENISWFYKLETIFEELYGVFKQFLGVKRIKYLDQTFEYDNPSAIFTILQYPSQVNDEVLELIDHPIKNVLDIGGNIGQFAITLDKMCDEIERIDIFEPNYEIWDLLIKNVNGIDSIRTYNIGIGKPGENSFYFTENKSAVGSLIPEIARYGNEALEEIKIDLVNDPSEITGINEYDLIVIDVEGFENEVIKNIKNVRTKYLYIELTSVARGKNYNSSDIFLAIEDKWGEYDILGQSELKKGDPAYDVLIRFKYQP